MGKKKYGDAGGGAWNFAARFLLSAAVTAGVVSLFRNLSWSDGPVGEKVPMPLQMLPTLPPTGSSKVQRRVLKHSNGLCVRPALEGASWLVLSDCGVMDNVVHISVGDEVQLHVGSACAVPEGKQIAVPVSAVPCNQREASYRKVTVGTDLFLLRPVDSEECLAPEGIDADSKPSDGTRLVLGDCQGESRYFQTSEAQTTFLGVKEDSVVARMQETSEAQPASTLSSNTLVHISGLCVTAQDEVTGEDSTVLMLQDCEDDPAKNIQFEPSGDAFRFQLGRQCGHAEDGPDASNEPRIAFPADCTASRHHFKYRKMAEDKLLPGFVIQSVDSPVEYCIHPYGGSNKPPVGTELINHRECEVGRDALRFRAGDPAELAKEEPKAKKPMGNPLIPVPQQEPCSYYGEGRSQSSRPGKPCIPPPSFWPYKGVTEWKTHLGQRTFSAVTPPIELTERRCGSFYLLGDQTWCMKAFDGSHGYGIIGLSFGIEERDIWGELVTQKFKIPVKLYDCFIPPERSPPISKTAPNNTVCPKNHLGEPKLDGICYGAAYDSFRVCLAGQEVTVAGRKYNTLEAQLKGFPKLSVHLKIDVEGSEWDVLEWLVANPDEWDKIRTLDMEIHFGFGSAAVLEKYKDLTIREQLEREVKIMESLLSRFYCTGSTLEVYRQGWSPEDNCGMEPCGEPPIYLANGFSVTAFAVSYVHKELVD